VYALPALLLPLGILMLLRQGAVTATEAGAVACLFAVVIGTFVYRRASAASFWAAAKESANDTAVILFLLAASGPLAWLLIAEQVPATVARSLEGIDNQALLMVLIVVFLLVVGLVLEPPPAMVLVVPILAPIAEAAGIDLVWLGVVLVLSIMLGQITPPVGGLIFIAAGVARAKVASVYWEARWLYLPVAVVLLLLVLFPALSLWLPGALGFGR
jgi:tripartite ATP-independent transporter DctM subunit